MEKIKLDIEIMQRGIKIKLSAIGLVLVFLITSGFGCKQGNLAAVNELEETVTLKYWRIFDDKDGFDDIINSYRSLHPNVNIEYRKLRYDEYEQALIEAWAEDRGPDMFSIHNTWVTNYEGKILPLPEKIKLPYVVARNKKTGKVEKADYQQIQTLTPVQIRDKFAEAVYQDVVRDGKVWGLPLSLDTLALFYNRAMFDRAQITKIPTTWLEVKEAVKKLTLLDQNGGIAQAGIALGGYKNINRASDILTLLMMQNGTQMVDNSERKATFNEPSPYASDRNYQPGLEALRFYTDFAMPAKEVYSWNNEMPEASEAFINGKVAMMLGYSYQIPLIRTQGAKLNLGIASVPHINSDGTDALSDKVNFASYWVETVSKKTEYADYAWDFLMFAAQEEQAIKYLNKTKKPTALRSLVNKQSSDVDISPFANQVLTARTWYRGKNPQAMESIFMEMIQQVIIGKNTLSEVISYGAQRINQVL